LIKVAWNYYRMYYDGLSQRYVHMPGFCRVCRVLGSKTKYKKVIQLGEPRYVDDLMITMPHPTNPDTALQDRHGNRCHPYDFLIGYQ